LSSVALVALFLCFASCLSMGLEHKSSRIAHLREKAAKKLTVPEATHSGYLSVRDDKQADLFYMFFEAQEPVGPMETTPIILWLQGGPGCASLFGMLYINGPYFLNVEDSPMTLRHNLGTWNRMYGMLFIDQPIGVGYSSAGSLRVPRNELQVGNDLYRGLQDFYKKFPSYQNRSLIATGESYAGKYVPSIAHYILQADAIANGYIGDIDHPRALPKNVEAPVFKLGGIAIGNGFTDAETQTVWQAQIAWSMGLINWHQKLQAEAMQQQVVDLVRSKEWLAARLKSDEINEFITNASGSAILEDIRRNIQYDAPDTTTTFLNYHHVKKAIGAKPDMTYVSCSPEVDQILAGDVMKSTKRLVEDLLHYYPVLIYAGQFDAECGVASNDAWLSTLPWKGHMGFKSAPRDLWRINGRVAGYWKHYNTLTHVVIRNTGHMTPHDNPMYNQLMIERWIEGQVMKRPYMRDTQVTPSEERLYANPDQGDMANPEEWWADDDLATTSATNMVAAGDKASKVESFRRLLQRRGVTAAASRR